MSRKEALDYVPSPFRVVIDTREQAPWHFKGMVADADKGRLPLVVDVTSKALKTGDYSIDGLEDETCIERKSAQDLFMSVTAERERFEREFKRMASMRWCAVVVEADLQTILTSPPTRSQVHPKVVIRTAMSWQMRYPNVHWWFCPSRPFAEQCCYRVLEMYWKKRQEAMT